MYIYICVKFLSLTLKLMYSTVIILFYGMNALPESNVK